MVGDEVKTIYVLRVNNYFPELCEITLPTIQRYARKIGARYQEITERKFPDWPVTYEKMQVHELGKRNNWSVLIDADTMIHPDANESMLSIPADHVGIHYGFDAHTMFNPDIYFLRDGRNRGIAAGLVITSRWTHDLWEPLDMPLEEALTRTKRAHILDEFCLSRNLAKYGLKYTGIERCPEVASWLKHIGVEGEDRKLCIEKAKAIANQWGI